MRLLEGRVAAPSRALVGAVGVVAAVGALAIAQRSGRFTTYAGRSSIGVAFTLAPGLALVTAGLVLAFGRQTRRQGDLALLAGVCWFAPIWVAWHAGPPIVPSTASILAVFFFPLVAHLVLAQPAGAQAALPIRLFVVVVYMEALVVAVALALFRDPYLDRGCWANCAVNSFRISSLPSLTNGIEAADRWFVAMAAAVLIAVCGLRLFRSSQTARARLILVYGPALLFAATVMVHAVQLQREGFENPFDNVLFTIFAVASVAIIALAVGLTLTAVRRGVERRAVLRVVADLGEAPTPGTLQEALGAALGDEELRIVYAQTGSGLYIDVRGGTVPEPVSGDGRTVTRVDRDGRTIALISHRGTVPDLEAHLGSAIRLGLENERLQAEVLAQLDRLRRSRARIVEAADSERRRLERDLHDGAQQRLLALLYEIRRAHASAQAEGDVACERSLARAVVITQSALDDLRALAHGIYPAVLTEAGLAPALVTLADTAPIPVELRGLDDGRYPPMVEATAYFAVAEAIDDAVARDADHAAATLARSDGRLVLTVEDDGLSRSSTTTALADRVGALGGSVRYSPTALYAEIPCA